MNILVTGASGFIGLHLIKSITLTSELMLTCISRKELKNDGENCKTLLLHDISEVSHQYLGEADSVIHLAGCAHAIFTESDYEEINHLSTLNLAEQAAKSGVKRFIFVSTVLVNGEEGIFRYDSSTAPQSLAAKTKLSAENAIKSVCDKSEMEFVIIRLPLVYGEGVKANFASLMSLVRKGVPLPFRAINRNKRSMVSVYNLVDLIRVCIEHPKAANNVFLASDDNDLSTAEMVALMAKVQSKHNVALPVPVWMINLAAKVLNKQDVVHRLTGSLQLDIEHTKKTLDWNPPYSVEHGFKLAAKLDTKND
jgi:UDP-glucose 4-epimerase